MLLFLNALAASIDGFIIGMTLKIQNVQLKNKNIITMFIGNLLIYAFVLNFYQFFHFSFINKYLGTILFLVLAYLSFHEKEEEKHWEKVLSLKECILLTLTHSIDGALISLNLIYDYPIILNVCIFSSMSIFLIILGFTFAKLFKDIKKKNYASSCLFLLLAFLNFFF